MKYMSLEISTKSIECAVINERGDSIHRSSFPVSLMKVRDVIEKVKPPIALVFEECDLAGWLFRNLVYEVDQVVVADPWHNRLIYNTDNKYDDLDALKLAHLLRGGFIHSVHHTCDQSRADFKNLVYAYHNSVKQLTRCKNQLKALYRQQGIIVKSRAVYSKEQRGEYLSQVSNVSVVKAYYEMVDLFSTQKEALEKQVERESRRYPEIARFDEIPGVGIITASTYYVVIDNPHRFNRKQKLWSYAHLGKGSHDSGGQKRHKRQKRGNRLLKCVTLQAVQAAIRSKPNPYRNQYIELVHVKGKDSRLAKRIVGRSILTTAWMMWKTEERYRGKTTRTNDVTNE